MYSERRPLYSIDMVVGVEFLNASTYPQLKDPLKALESLGDNTINELSPSEYLINLIANNMF